MDSQQQLIKQQCHVGLPRTATSHQTVNKHVFEMAVALYCTGVARIACAEPCMYLLLSAQCGSSNVAQYCCTLIHPLNFDTIPMGNIGK